MSEPNKYREWILQTIDSLRSRKARPDLERICRMVQRRHGSDPQRTRAELEKLIREQTVLKVSYKGSISYRNAAKVQRKNRKKTELAVVIVGSGGGGVQEEEEEAEEGANEHEHLHNKNSDSAQHSCSDLEEELDFENDSEPSPGSCAPAGACMDPGEPPASNPGSGSSCQGGCCGATTSSDRVESGCKKIKEASAPRDSEGLSDQQGAAHSPGTGANEHRDARGGDEAMELSPSGADSHDRTCSRSALSPPLLSPSPHQEQHRVREVVNAKPKVLPGAGGTKSPRSPSISEPGDRLQARARSSRGRPCNSSAAVRGHMKPLGLKEILGYLSSQERLSEEKLTRGKVKVVMEREVAGGRLRRNRCGNITLPPRGASGRMSLTKVGHIAQLDSICKTSKT